LSNRRKPKNLVFNSKVTKINDIKTYHLATVLGRQHDGLTEQSLMVMGGELFEISRRGLQNMKLTDSHDSLNMRLQLTKELQSAEKRWRDRLLKILEKGLAFKGKKVALFQTNCFYELEGFKMNGVELQLHTSSSLVWIDC